MRRMLTSWFERWTTGERSFGLYVFAALARPCSWLYHLGLVLRGARTQLHRGPENARLIVVSSPLVGGVGKTPLTILLAQRLRERERRVAVVTMGYGRDNHTRASFSVKSLPPTTDVGDEGMEIGIFTRADIHTGPDPADVIAELDSGHTCDWIVFDDGVSRRWANEARIVMMSSDTLESHVHYLPFGRWRTLPSLIARADFVAITTDTVADNRDTHLRRLQSWKYQGKVGWFMQRALGMARWDDSGTLDVPVFPRTPALVYCGIARPHRFISMVRDLGVQVATSVTFPDHHSYSMGDCAQLEALRIKSGAEWYLTTFKDIVRTPVGWPASTPLLYLRISLHQVAGDDITDLLAEDKELATQPPHAPTA